MEKKYSNKEYYWLRFRWRDRRSTGKCKGGFLLDEVRELMSKVVTKKKFRSTWQLLVESYLLYIYIDDNLI